MKPKEDEEEEERDFISKLPNEIIVSILSRLDTIEEQARVSVLARRWRHLWKLSTTTNLVFVLEHRNQSSEFVSHVNQVINAVSTTSTNIDTFKLVLGSCDKDGMYQHDVDEWLNLALPKRVKHVSLSLLLSHHKFYSLSGSQVMSRIRNQSLVLDSLTSLRLCQVDVSGEDLEYILSASPLLEELFVSEPGESLVKFTVSGWSLKLKHLEFCCFSSFHHLDIHDVNLESLKFIGDGECLTIRDTPRIVKAGFPLFRDISDLDFANRILSNLPQLEMLVWRPCRLLPDEEFNQFPEYLKLSNLEQLILELDSKVFCVRLCALLLDASPLLCELKLKFNRLKESDKEDKVNRLKHPHQSLKVVEIVGFVGCELDLGVASYLIENTAALETMTISTHPIYGWMLVDPRKQQAARALVRTHLEPMLSPRTKMIVK